MDEKQNSKTNVQNVNYGQKKMKDVIISYVLNVKQNGVGCVENYIMFFIFQKENVVGYNFINQKQNLILKIC